MPFARLAAGTILDDRYAVGELVAQGGMGEVYSAQTTAGEHVAVKRLLDERHAARFAIEARLLAQLGHPRVVRVLDHFTVADASYLVMAFVDGAPLSQRLRAEGRPGLAVDTAVELISQACEALAYVHSQSIVHRDVKPGNLIDGDDGVVLVDFGIAREHAPGGADATRGVGTPGFMAPEVLAGAPVSPRTDVFGITATLWTLLAGHPPAFGEAPPEAAVDAGLAPVLLAGLEPDPQRRIASAEAFAAALGADLSVLPGASLARSVPNASAPARLLEAIARAAASVFEAAASSFAIVVPESGDLVYEAAWGAGARELCGSRLPAGTGIAGSVAATGTAEAIASVVTDQRWARLVAERTGYTPNTMLVLPVHARNRVHAVLSILDRRDGRGYGPDDLVRAQSFVELVVVALGLSDAVSEAHTQLL